MDTYEYELITGLHPDAFQAELNRLGTVGFRAIGSGYIAAENKFWAMLMRPSHSAYPAHSIPRIPGVPDVR